MKQYKIDMHVHTSETSPCGRVKAKELVCLYKGAGYDGVVITDHYFDEFFYGLGDMKWEDKVDVFLAGYKNAAREGEKAGLRVMLGIEIRFSENYNDYLIYGINEGFLKEYPELYKLGLKGFKKLAGEKGMLVFQAHPFRPEVAPADPALLDGVEVYNGNPRHDSRNHLAMAFAEKNGLLKISGSDFHQIMDLARGGIVISESVSTSRELAQLLLSRRVLSLLETA